MQQITKNVFVKMAVVNVGPNVKSPKPKGLLFELGKLDGAVVGHLWFKLRLLQKILEAKAGTIVLL